MAKFGFGGSGLPTFTTFTPIGGSEAPPGTPIPGNLGGVEIPGLGVTVQDAVDIGGFLKGLFNGGGGPITDQTGGAGFAACEPGFVKNQFGICEFIGSPADVSTGQPGTALSTAVMTPFGLSVPSITVGEIRGNPIRRCPPKLVLGPDNRCYSTGKGGIQNSQRKWPRAPRATVSAFDAKMMRRYGPGGSKRDSIKKLAADAGFSCKNK